MPTPLEPTLKPVISRWPPQRKAPPVPNDFYPERVTAARSPGALALRWLGHIRVWHALIKDCSPGRLGSHKGRGSHTLEEVESCYSHPACSWMVRAGLHFSSRVHFRCLWAWYPTKSKAAVIPDGDGWEMINPATLMFLCGFFNLAFSAHRTLNRK